jgi:hypothetical protein
MVDRTPPFRTVSWPLVSASTSPTACSAMAGTARRWLGGGGTHHRADELPNQRPSMNSSLRAMREGRARHSHGVVDGTIERIRDRRGRRVRAIVV